MKGFRTLLILAIAFVALVGVLFLQEKALNENAPPTVPPQPTPILERVFPELELSRITAIRMIVPDTGRELIIARNEGGEWVAPALDGTFDQEAAVLIGRTMVLLPYRRSFDIDETTNLAQYGFDPNGGIWLQLFTIDEEEHTVAIGDPSFDSPTFYALVDDRPTLYLIERPPIDFLLQYFVNPPVTPSGN